MAMIAMFRPLMLAFAVLCTFSQPGFGMEMEAKLPAPTGQFAVGRVAYHWTDPARPETFSSQKGSQREMMVYLFYPAKFPANASPAPYFPGFGIIENSIGQKELTELFGAAYSAVKGGKLRTHAFENAKISSSSEQYPLLVFSPGFGEFSLTYTAMLEDLASHGFVIAAIEHPYDSSCVVFPDGRIIPFAQTKWDAAKAKPGGAVAYQIDQIPIRAADVRFVLDQLIRLGKAERSGLPWAGHLNLNRIGVFGHSLGGMGAARACETDVRICACMNQDSDYQGAPFISALPGKTIKQPFLFFASDHSLYLTEHKLAPTDEQLARENLTRNEYNRLIHQYQKNQDEALAGFSGGSYRVAVETPGFNHRSFMDTNLLKASDDPKAVDRNLHNLQIVRAYTLAFFNKYLKDCNETLLGKMKMDERDSKVKVDRFGAAAQ